MDEMSTPGRFGDRFRRVAVGFLALAVMLAALAAYLQHQASLQQELVSGQVHGLALQQLGAEVAGEVELSYHTRSAYAQWLALERLAGRAAPGDVARLRTAQEAVAALSPLLGPPYFDPDVDAAPDVARFAVDTYREEAIGRGERFADRVAAQQAWAMKADTYALTLLLLAVALFLSGISLVVARDVRWVFLGSGMLMAGFAAYWMLGTSLASVAGLSTEAVAAYAHGVGLSEQAKFAEARLAFDKAVALEPGYGNAYVARGEAEQRLGNLSAAAADLEAAQRAGRDDAHTAWKLGWNEYLLGDFAGAVEAYEHALALAPELVAARFDLGLALLADGQAEAARAEIEQGITDTAVLLEQARMNQSQPPASLWVLLDDAAMGFENLNDRLAQAERPWTAAPPAEAIADPEAVRLAAAELAAAIKSAAVALEFGGQLAVGGEGIQVTPFVFSLPGPETSEHAAATVEPTGGFPAATDAVAVSFDFNGAEDGLREVWKVYVDGIEDPAWRVEDKWADGAAGHAARLLARPSGSAAPLAAGEYRVELYLDNRLVQSGTFTVAATIP